MSKVHVTAIPDDVQKLLREVLPGTVLARLVYESVESMLLDAPR
ncbi:hypothetical protein [Azohydromonas lata]|uniref:Transposase n=1 Tax=Azohydromonas lata TaxID=45677 RepID=A0ABU5I853_9BURK|nr:hypothetical protein [Azohydromonas lata]MDZ5455276.1 hypothetical protein [Azohydromonas lata]